MPRLSRPCLATLVLCLAGAAAEAQTPTTTTTPPPPAPAPTSGSDRLFLSFGEDATLIDGQWWEGQAELADADVFDATLVRVIAAVKVRGSFEAGGRVGFGSTDGDDGVPDGTGATDLEMYGKWYFGAGGQRMEFAAGANLIVPTGDDHAGLGADSFAVGAFGAMRYRFDALILSGNVGLRFNGDGQVLGSADLDGKTSPWAGVGAIWPVSEALSLVGEARWESKRFEQADDDARVLVGLDLRVSARGRFRGAVAAGLDDGAPDTQVLLGYAHLF